jgi:hypothetical protein
VLAEKKLMGYITESSLDLCVVKQQIKMGKSQVSTELKYCILKSQQKAKVILIPFNCLSSSEYKSMTTALSHVKIFSYSN